jgi:hypothetical protein
MYACVSQIVSPFQVFPAKILYAFLPFPIDAVCSTHLILMDVISLLIFGE